MRNRKAFTMIELIFVIVVMGIIGKFGVEFIAQAYKSFIYTSINHQLQSNSATAVEFISKRLENRIKDSVIVRTTAVSTVPIGLGSSAVGTTYRVLEWVGTDNEGFRGLTNTPTWSGIMDLDAGVALGANTLVSPATDTGNTNTIIQALSYQNSNINDSALYFIGSNSDVQTGYGWSGTAAEATIIANQLGTMHPINTTGVPTQFTPITGAQTYANIDIYEYYKLAWTAYAIVYQTGANSKGVLRLYWNYQPWLGESYNDVGINVQNAIIMEDVSTFKFVAIGSIIKIQICVKSDILEDYSLCKEKTVF